MAPVMCCVRCGSCLDGVAWKMGKRVPIDWKPEMERMDPGVLQILRALHRAFGK